MNSPSRRRINFLLISLLGASLCQCKPEEPEEVFETPEIKTRLPIASSVKKIGCHGGVIATVRENGYQVTGHPITNDDTELAKQLADAHKKTRVKYQPLLYLIADPQTPFKRITHLIRASAKSGFATIFFVAKPKEDSPNIIKHFLELNLPVADGSQVNSNIEPVLLRIDAQGSVYHARGKLTDLLDSDNRRRDLPMLREIADAYTAGAHAGGLKAQFQIWADPEVSYQRVIDVLNAIQPSGFAGNQIIFTTHTDDHVHRDPAKKNRRPRIQPLPRPPR